MYPESMNAMFADGHVRTGPKNQQMWRWHTPVNSAFSRVNGGMSPSHLHIYSNLSIRWVEWIVSIQPLSFGNGQGFTYISLLDMWLQIHAGIKVDPC